jgi:hypothetical protein
MQGSRHTSVPSIQPQPCGLLELMRNRGTTQALLDFCDKPKYPPLFAAYKAWIRGRLAMLEVLDI